MKLKLLAVVAVVGALAWAVPPAMADTGGGGAGALQAGVQQAATDQQAGAAAISKQDATNANVPVNIAGGNVSAGPSSANQLASPEAEAKAKASNDADTTQKQTQTQNVDGSSCHVGCGGAGAAQIGVQAADTKQDAAAAAISKQNAVNANVPVNVAGGNITSGPSSANQLANSEAEAK